MSNRKPEIPQGDTGQIEVSVVDAQGSALSLAGASIEWKMSRHRTATAEVLLSKSVGFGIAITDAGGGKFQIELSPSETAALDAGDYFHQARITLQSGRVVTALQQYLTITETI